MRNRIGTTETYDTDLVYDNAIAWRKSTYIHCACHSPEHTLEIIQDLDSDSDPRLMSLLFSVQLRTGTLWNRIRNAWFYLLGRKSRYGDYDEIVVDDIDTIRKIGEIANDTANVIEKARAEWEESRPSLITWWFDNRRNFWLVDLEDGQDNNIVGLDEREPGWYIEMVNIKRGLLSVHEPNAHNWYGPFSYAMRAISFMRYREDHIISSTITCTDSHLPFNKWEAFEGETYCELFINKDTSQSDIEEAKKAIACIPNDYTLRIVLI